MEYMEYQRTKKQVYYLTIGALIVFIFFLWWSDIVLKKYLLKPANAQTSTQDEIMALEKDIQEQKRLLDELKAQEDMYTKRIREKQSERITLTNQIAIIDEQTKKIATEIQATQIQIAKLDLELEKLQKEIKIKNASIAASKEQLAALIRLIFNLDQRTLIETFLLHDRFSEIFEEFNHLENINIEIKKALADLMYHKEELNKKVLQSSDTKEELEGLALELKQKKDRLDAQREIKGILLAETHSSEQQFQNLLAQAKAEQENANYEIVKLQEKVSAKLKKLQKEEALAALSSDFIWPVPKNTITAYFHDPSYPYRHIFEHSAIDIRAEQGTIIKAAASGYVARAKDGGYGYSYIMIVHNNNLATIYGHVSCILVQEDTFVAKGEKIGCVGGIPGTRGAGRFTTGSHLHFEIRQNGIPINPLEYLP